MSKGLDLSKVECAGEQRASGQDAEAEGCDSKVKARERNAKQTPHSYTNGSKHVRHQSRKSRRQAKQGASAGHCILNNIMRASGMFYRAPRL
jgi:hypothetical protein